MADGEGVLSAVFGDSGFGKTTDDLYSFPRALYLPVHEDAVKPAWHTCGFRLQKRQVLVKNDLTSTTRVFEDLAQRYAKSRRPLFGAVVVDDLTLKMNEELRKMKASGQYAAKNDSYSFQIWTDLEDKLQRLIELARYEIGPVRVIMNAHTQDPSIDTKTQLPVKGGPQVGSKKMVKIVPRWSTSIYRTVMTDRKPWGGAYEIEPTDDYYMKCRYGYRGIVPMNLAELLRGAGETIEYPEGLEWIGQYVAAGYKRMQDGESFGDVAKRIIDKLGGKDERHINWVLRDLQDRVVIRKARQKSPLSWVS